MSQHVHKAKYQTDMATVTIGWDRPLQGFFMRIVFRDQSLYDSLGDTKLIGGFSSDLSYFSGILKRLGIEVPQEMMQELRLDAKNDVGNKIRHHL